MGAFKRDCPVIATIFTLILSLFGFTVGCSVLCLLCEIFNFTLIAVFIYYFGTTRYTKYDQRIENEKLNDIIEFITNGRSNSDKALRVFSINQNCYRSFATIDRKRKLERYRYSARIDDVEQSQSLEAISWKNMRLNAMDDKQSEYANFWNHIRLKTMFKTLKKELSHSIESHPRFRDCVGCLGVFALYCLFPLYLLSKVLTFSYPLIIVGIVFVDGFELPMFQVIMLGIYVLMIIIVVIIGIPSLRLLYYLWHVAPGDEHIILLRIDMDLAHENYDKMMLNLLIAKLLNKAFGKDIADVVMDYYRELKVLSYNEQVLL